MELAGDGAQPQRRLGRGAAHLFTARRFSETRRPRPIGIGAHFGTLKEGYWSYLQITLRAWRERANASLVILTDQAAELRGRLGQTEDTAGDLGLGLRGLARREQGWGALTEVIVQPVNVTRMSSSWGVVKELQGATTCTRSPRSRQLYPHPYHMRFTYA